MPPDERFDPAPVIESISEAMLTTLDPGQMARLRRMEIDGPGTVEFWDTAARCKFIDRASRPDRTPRWLAFVRILAILTAKGREKDRGVLHQRGGGRSFGAALCDGGRTDWADKPEEKADPRPFVSEAHLARFMARPASARVEDLETFARMIAARRDAAAPIDCLDLYHLIFTDGPEPLRRLASQYYRRLDGARRKAKEQDEP